MLRVAEHWGDSEPRCRFDTLPAGNPLREIQCDGRLEVDHMKGDGTQEYRGGGDGGGLMRQIARGRRTMDDLRILCELHQLWNRLQWHYIKER